MRAFKNYRRSILILLRDISIVALLVYGISLWQTRHLLDDDGTVTLENTQLMSLSGNVQPLFENNKRTLIYFFAPWCKICEVSINNLAAINDPELRIVRVALDYQTQNDVQTFVDNNDVEGQVLLGNAQLKQQFRIPGYPTYYLIDKQQQVVGHSFGYSTAIGLKLKNYLNK